MPVLCESGRGFVVPAMRQNERPFATAISTYPQQPPFAAQKMAGLIEQYLFRLADGNA